MACSEECCFWLCSSELSFTWIACAFAFAARNKRQAIAKKGALQGPFSEQGPLQVLQPKLCWRAHSRYALVICASLNCSPWKEEEQFSIACNKASLLSPSLAIVDYPLIGLHMVYDTSGPTAYKCALHVHAKMKVLPHPLFAWLTTPAWVCSALHPIFLLIFIDEMFGSISLQLNLCCDLQPRSQSNLTASNYN